MKIRILAMVAVAALILAACQSPASLSTPRKAALTIQIGNNINSRTLLPNIDMNPASYTVTGSGPNNATFTTTTTGGAVTESSLAFGSWTVVVNATNAAGNLIGTGSATTQVNTASTSTVSVTVTPVSGVGTLSLAASWPSGSVQTPSVAATLTPALGSEQNLPFSISGSSASYSSSSVGNGYYTLALTVQDTGVVVAGAVDVVRIVTGATTSGTYAFSQVNAPGGTIQVNVAANMQNPLTVAIAGASATQAVGTSQTLTASVSNYTGNVVYVWYVNGVSAGTGPTFAFNAGSVVGYTYRIDVTAFSADGTQAGSATTSVGAVAAPIFPSSFQNITYETTRTPSDCFPLLLSVAYDSSTGTIAVGTGGSGLLTSTNGGSTWTQHWSGNGLADDGVLGIALNGSTIYAGTTSGLSVSFDGGTTWTTKLPGQSVSRVAFAGTTIYAATYGGGLAISNDGGATWTYHGATSSLNSNSVSSIQLVGSDVWVSTQDHGVAVSHDGGSTWSALTTANGLPSNDALGIAFSGSQMWVATSNGVSTSLDGGGTWTNFLAGKSTQGLAVSGSLVCVATAGGVYLSTDQGASWSLYSQTNGLANNNVRGVSASGSSIFVATDNGLSMSLNSGSNWSSYSSVHGLVSNVLSVAVVGSEICAGTSSGVGISHDGGATWTMSSTTNGLADNTVWGVAISGSTIYAATMAGLSVTTNSGVSWASLGSFSTPGLYDVQVSGSQLIVSTQSQGVWISTDAGATWTSSSYSNGLPTGVVYHVQQSGSQLYAATPQGLAVSSNNGGSWINLTAGLPSTDVTDVALLGSTIYAATAAGLGISADGGVTWKTKTENDGLPSNWLNAVSVSGALVYASTTGGLAISGDSGQTWRSYSAAQGLGSGGQPRHAVVSSTKVYLPTSAGLAISQ